MTVGHVPGLSRDMSSLRTGSRELLFAQTPAALGQHLLLLAQPAVAIVERRDAQAELALLPLEPRLRRDGVTFPVGHVDLARLHAPERRGQPRAALLQLGRSALERKRTLVELPRALVEPGEPRLLLAHVARAPCDLRLLLRELRGTPPQTLFARSRPCLELLELYLPRGRRTLLPLERLDTRRQRRLCLGHLRLLPRDHSGARLKLRRAGVELPQRRTLGALLLRDLRRALRHLRLLCRQRLGSPLLRIESCARGRDPFSALLELGAQHAQLARTRIELAGAPAQPVRLGRHVLDRGLLAPQLLRGECNALLARAQLFLSLLDELPPRVEVGGDLLVAPRARIDLCRAARHRLVDQALALGQRLPRLVELVRFVRHTARIRLENRLLLHGRTPSPCRPRHFALR